MLVTDKIFLLKIKYSIAKREANIDIGLKYWSLPLNAFSFRGKKKHPFNKGLDTKWD